MTLTIAVAGKGGTGKTTISSLVIRYLIKNKRTPVLAVDADPNANLGESLGLKVDKTIGAVLAEFQKEKITIPPGMTKEAYLDVKLNEVIVESKDLDLVSMGRGEGRDCYCYPNTVLRNFIDRLAGSYPGMVMDNEAGMEHLSRATTQNVDELLLVSDHSIKGIRTVARIRDLVAELGLIVKRESVIVNMVSGEIDPGVRAEAEKLGLIVFAAVPLDKNVGEYDLEVRPLLELPDDSPAVKAVDAAMANLLK
jgi:CO dehydrogenase maturation factor